MSIVRTGNNPVHQRMIQWDGDIHFGRRDEVFREEISVPSVLCAVMDTETMATEAEESDAASFTVNVAKTEIKTQSLVALVVVTVAE